MMRRYLALLATILLFACAPKTAPQPQQDTSQKDATALSISGLDVCFSPAGGCEAKIVNFINAEDKEILVQAYSFTDVNIENALIAKKGRHNLPLASSHLTLSGTRRLPFGSFSSSRLIGFVLKGWQVIGYRCRGRLDVLFERSRWWVTDTLVQT